MSSLSPAYLETFRRQYNLEVFVETGCYMGDGIAAALEAGFSLVYSCDISGKHVGHCLNRFAGDRRIRIDIGDSLTALGRQLKDPFPAALFWLDGHYPAFYGMADLETERTRFPIVQELGLIHELRRGALYDVILIDDMRVVAAPDNLRWHPGEVDAYYRVDDLTIDSIASPFDGSHDAEVDCQQEGILRITPRLSGVS